MDAAEIERRLEAGESIEVYAAPKEGLKVAAAGAVMAGFFGAIYLPRAIEDAFFAIGLGVVAVPAILAFTTLVWVGLRRWRTPPRMLALTPEGIEAFMRTRVLRWEDLLSVEVTGRGRAIEVEARPGTDLGMGRLERRAHMGRKRVHGVVLPARMDAFDEGALVEFLERRIEREMLEGSTGVDALFESASDTERSA